MKKKFFRWALLMPAIISVSFISCEKKPISEPVVDPNSPAFHIAESESMVIPDAIKLPDNLPEGNSRVATFFAVGVQKYRAKEKAGSNPVTFEWVFVAPRADLFDASNNKVGIHSAGPVWTLSTADSMYGQATNPPSSAPASDPNSIDWLLLEPKTDNPPTGAFAEVSYLQRIATNGGKAPATPPANENETVDVPYTAIYRFSKKN